MLMEIKRKKTLIKKQGPKTSKGETRKALFSDGRRRKSKKLW